ncbi:MAG TPA: ABC transporter ATP-binding protein [Candidatus Paceibacterota bacterium]|nr:ABC transporter ATP-binding protein [Candidatus Paceibacterota bacterium]
MPKTSLLSALRGYREALNETLTVSKWVTIDMNTPELMRWWFRFLAWLALAIGINAIFPITIGLVITAAARADFEAAYWLIGLVLVLALAQEFFHRCAGQAREWLWGLGMRIIEDRISTLLFEKSVGQHLQEGSRLTVGNLERGQAAAFFVRELWIMNLIPELVMLVMFPIALIAVFPLGGTIACVAVLVHMLWTIVMNRHLIEQGEVIDEKARAMRRYQRDRWDKAERVKTSGAAARELERIDLEANTWLTMDRDVWVKAIDGFMFRGWLMHVSAVLVMFAALLSLKDGAIAVGVLYTAFALMYSTKAELDQLSHTTRTIMRNIPSVKKLRETLLMPPDIVHAEHPARVSAEEPIRLTFDGVGHGFVNGNGSVPILSSVSFSIEPGEKAALIGPSGAGKTTLMRLALRYMDPDRGRICVNGMDLRDVNLDDWMRVVGYIPQHAQIFDGTVGENLRYALEDPTALTDEEVWKLARDLQIDFGERLTDGLDTVVGRNGIKLSGGQAQRLMIGAAAIKRPKFMIIDEATSSLDATTERLVHDGLRDILGPGVGALIVTHRLSTVRDLCNRFVVLRPLEQLDGQDMQIEAIGRSFEELFASSPTFRKIAADQGIVS